MYFKKILIANRGEIAVRVIHACHELAIAAVAVYSEADRAALHVRLADEAYRLGPTPAAQSYLRVEALIDAVQHSGAEAIHPGYGFLSERAHFAQACDNAGIVFIGPTAHAIEQMGSKIEAKRLAIAHDVPVVPGYDGADQSLERLATEAERIGYPLLIKASAGGGGKGMRTVTRAADFAAALAAAQREAQAAFGNAEVLLERLILRARHVEIQVLGDQHGTLLYLGERECSIQRRHQKIIEEAPSPALDPHLRARMGEAAVRVARAVGYTNAGTVEFMLDADGNFYFLEMNTRLQVEHPVTEAVFGRDLVQLQIAIAAGEPLAFGQSELLPRGHAIEARIYAEDPVAMLPAVGQVVVFDPPVGPGIRNDVGLSSGDEVTTAYDPMLAKLIVYAPDRAAAIRRMQQALHDYAVVGLTTNIPLLQHIIADPAFAAGDTFTDFLTVNPIADALAAPHPTPFEVIVLAALWQVSEFQLPADPWATPWGIKGNDLRVRLRNDVLHEVVLQAQDAGWHLILAGESHQVISIARRDALLVAQIDGRHVRAHIARVNGALLVSYGGRSYRLGLDEGLSIDDLLQQSSNAPGHAALTAPMPGTIISVLVAVGQRVAAAQPLVIMEAMKMEHTLAAPHAGLVAAVPFNVGQSVSAGATLVELDAADPASIETANP
ncbi:MAG: acetyl-CoA carboxylase biotin carboxylase subunit [Herpetosiphonaceae bacterium]|nr:acetyl-CoA carboxylase biotin carboxylase subunit [Herpetosiphonaceae bacterium]